MIKSIMYSVFSGFLCTIFIFGWSPITGDASLFGAFLSGGIFGVSIVSIFQRKK
jgi:hypothetical protein